MALTVDDPTYYTQPWKVMVAVVNFYWMKDQDFEENFCVPSEAGPPDKVVVPSGNYATSQ